MNHSVKDIGILTAYSALMLSSMESLSIILIIGSCAAFLLLLFIFGLSSIKKLIRPRRSNDGVRSFVPLAVILILWLLIFMITPYFPISVIHPRVTYFGSHVASAMFCGLSAATIPLMFNLDSQHMELNDETLWVGYWSACTGMIGSGLSACVMILIYKDAARDFGIIRFPSVIGMICSVLVTWYLIGILRREKDGKRRDRHGTADSTS